MYQYAAVVVDRVSCLCDGTFASEGWKGFGASSLVTGGDLDLVLAGTHH